LGFLSESCDRMLDRLEQLHIFTDTVLIFVNKTISLPARKTEETKQLHSFTFNLFIFCFVEYRLLYRITFTACSHEIN